MAGSWLINGGDPNHLLTRMIPDILPTFASSREDSGGFRRTVVFRHETPPWDLGLKLYQQKKHVEQFKKGPLVVCWVFRG